MSHLTNGDLSLIEACFTEKRWRGAEICRQFPARNWNPRQINRAIKRYETTGTLTRKSGSGTKKPAKTQQNIRRVTEMSLSQEDSPGTHKSQREIARIVKIGKGSVYRFQKSLGLKSVKRLHTPQRTEGAINRRKIEKNKAKFKAKMKDLENQLFVTQLGYKRQRLLFGPYATII